MIDEVIAPVVIHINFEDKFIIGWYLKAVFFDVPPQQCFEEVNIVSNVSVTKICISVCSLMRYINEKLVAILI